MKKSDRLAALKLGLEQIPPRDLLRLKRHIDDGKPLLLDGGIYDGEKGCPMFVALPIEEQQRIKQCDGRESAALAHAFERRTRREFEVNPVTRKGSGASFIQALQYSTPADVLAVVEGLLA